uniref:Anion exchange protein n=1 Tax=Echeneis naucrates TaxID=173247 RepID=A0A665WTF1_ECHNA
MDIKLSVFVSAHVQTNKLLQLEVKNHRKYLLIAQEVYCSYCKHYINYFWPLITLNPDTPSQRVQFILGTEDDDLEHVPHDLFTELDELSFRDGSATEWRETARWLKFEEDVEDGGERWSKPYVATLSLHSLFELRSCILNGTVMLDMRANSFYSCIFMVREAMLKKHHHQNERKLSNRIPLVRSIADIGEGLSSSRLSLHKQGASSSVSNLTQRQESRVSVLLNHLLPSSSYNTGSSPGPSPFSTPQNTPTFFRRSAPSPSCARGTGLGPQAELPINSQILTHCPSLLLSFLVFLPGPLVSPNSAPSNLDGNKAAERRPSKVGVSRESSTIDFKPTSHSHYNLASVGGIFSYGSTNNGLKIDQSKRKRPSQPNGNASPAGELEKEEDHNIGPELQRTGRLFGGLIMDIKRKAPFYWSDIRDSFSLQCLASILFLYCACMSPVITFGGLLGEATKGNISAIESLFGASLTGVAYSLFAGQPLTILGSTGPVLVFEKILFKFCNDYGISYLSLRTSIGLWTAFLCLVLVATDASSLVCYITRFTEEAFAALICIIFIYEALEKLFHLGERYPINMQNNLDNLTLYSCQCSPPANVSDQLEQVWNQTGYSPDSIQWSSLNVSMCKKLHGEFVGSACGHHGPYIPDVLFWSIILFFTTFCLSSFLKQFKTERYFPTKVRSSISDFAVFITIMIMVLVDYLMGIPSPKLHVPDRFEPTSKNRGWLIDPLGENPWWTLLVAALPALLCTILIFMDQQITAVIINRKEHKLKKGCGYHLDLLVVALMLGICSIMGLPWFVAATVLSISHVNSLKVESHCSAPGEQPKFLGIREQRVTGFMIFILMGCSVFMTSVLKFIPMPVLYGVFLYMGYSSLKGIQFFDRIKLFGMPAKHQPDLIYLRYVPLWKVHIFTLVQLSCLVLLWVIKASAAAVVFPMMVLALVFVRKLLDFFFTKRELSWLDDLMPESKKKKEDDKKKKAREKLVKPLFFLEYFFCGDSHESVY